VGSAPVKDGHGEICNYAPAFRSAIDDIYNSITGLTLKDVSGREGWSLSRFSNIPSADESLSRGIHEPSLATTPLSNEGLAISLQNNQALREDMNTTPSPNRHFDTSGSESQPQTPTSEPDTENAQVETPSPSILSESEMNYILYSSGDAPLQPLTPSPFRPPREVSTVSRFSSSASDSSSDSENDNEKYVSESNEKRRFSAQNNKFLREEVDLRIGRSSAPAAPPLLT